MTTNPSCPQETYRYCLSQNDLDIIKHYTKKPISDNARKTLTILSEVFGGLHHLDDDQLSIFDYQSDRYNQYLLNGSLATFDNMTLTCLVIIAHDMAVRFEIQSTILDPSDYYDRKLLQLQVNHCNSEYGTKFTVENMNEQLETRSSWLRLLFHQRVRDGDFSHRHPILEDSMEGFRKGNKRYA